MNKTEWKKIRSKIIRRDEYRARAEAAEAEVARLRSALEQLTTCECGKHLSTPVCPICDNDE